jgi:hypothetical protein
MNGFLHPTARLARAMVERCREVTAQIRVRSATRSSRRCARCGRRRGRGHFVRMPPKLGGALAKRSPVTAGEVGAAASPAELPRSTSAATASTPPVCPVSGVADWATGRQVPPGWSPRTVAPGTSYFHARLGRCAAFCANRVDHCWSGRRRRHRSRTVLIVSHGSSTCYSARSARPTCRSAESPVHPGLGSASRSAPRRVG